MLSLTVPLPPSTLILLHMTDAGWQPDPDSGWGMTFAGDAAHRVWAIFNSLSRAMDGPDGVLIAQRIAGDTDPDLFRDIVRWRLDDMALALGKPRPYRETQPMSYAEKVADRDHLLENAQAMLADVEVQIEALNRMPEIVSAIQSAESRAEAAVRLQSPPFNYSDWQAFYVLDMTVASQTAAGVALLTERRDELTEAVRRLGQPIEPPDPSE